MFKLVLIERKRKLSTSFSLVFFSDVKIDICLYRQAGRGWEREREKEIDEEEEEIKQVFHLAFLLGYFIN